MIRPSRPETKAASPARGPQARRMRGSVDPGQAADDEGPERSDAVPVHLGQGQRERAASVGGERGGLVAGFDIGLDGGDQVVAGGSAEFQFDGPGSGQAEVGAVELELVVGDPGCLDGDGSDAAVGVAESQQQGFDRIVGRGVDGRGPGVESDEVGGDFQHGDDVSARDGLDDGVVLLLDFGLGAGR